MKAGKTITEASPEEFITWTNKRSGEVSQVPVGVSPGFDYNPGLAQSRLNALQQVGRGKLEGAAAPLRNSAMKPVTADGVSPEFSKAVEDAFARLPEAARKSVAAAGYEVRIVDRIVRAAPDLMTKGAIEFEQIDGLTRFSTRQILIAEQAFNSESRSWQIAAGDRGSAVLAHEIGHALDEIHRLAENPVLQATWRNEANLLAAYGLAEELEIAREIAYFTQPWPRGVLETIAELYALRHSIGTASHLNVQTAFPETASALNQLLNELEL